MSSYIVSSGVTSTGVTLSYDSMYVYDGGTANSTTVNWGGNLTVYDGGTANSTTVNAFGAMYVSSGGTALRITENGGNVYVADGAEATFVSNTFGGLTLAGGQAATVHSGTTANSAAVSSGGRLYVYSGGTANSAAVNSRGNVIVSSGGLANGTFIASRGVLSILSGGTADNTAMDAYSYFYISSGGTARDTTLGWRCSMFVSAGASAVDTAIDAYARLNVWVDSDTYMTGTVAGRSFEVKNGVLSDFILYQNGNIYVSSGCSALNVVQDYNNYVLVSSGGYAENFTLNNGTTLDVAGEAFLVTVNNGGTLLVSSTARDIAVNNGGTLNVFQTAGVSGGTVLSGGTLNVSGGTIVNLCVSSGASCAVSGGSVLEGLHLYAGAISLSGAVDAHDADVLFVLSDRQCEDDVFVDDIACLDAASYTVIVGEAQAAGVYRIVGNAAAFDKTITVKNQYDATICTLAANSACESGGRSYSLDIDDGTLCLSISGDPAATGEPNPPGANAGLVLTSTRWNQKRIIYINIDGQQTPLEGYEYNQYCPYLSKTEHERSATGCINTSVAQIVYYWLEKGYDITFEPVTADDYFRLKSDDELHFMSESPEYGEPSISLLNELIFTEDRVGNGDFIAALNFYCGLKNHSNYGGSTGASWAAFNAAGFDGHYVVGRGQYNDLYFKDDAAFNEIGYSVIRECLEYGEPLRMVVPGHSIYMDGYRINDETGGYEYHLNYGWGMSGATRWYTAEEMDTLSLVNFTFDLSPDIKVKVINDRGDYYGGSFLRGIERINHIENDRATTFTFNASLAGKTIVTNRTAEITSDVDVAFENICVTLATTGSALFRSARGMDFDIDGGNIVAKSGTGACAICETGDGAVNVTIRNGFIYSGYTTTDLTDLDGSLHPESGFSFETSVPYFYRSIAGYAVKSGAADDTITLESDAAIFGDLDLGDGDNQLNIGAGSLFYGGFVGGANTLTVKLTVDCAADAGAQIAFSDAASGQAFYTATGGEMDLHFSNPRAKAGSYVLLYGIDPELAGLFSINLTVNGQTKTIDSEQTPDSRFRLSTEADRLVLNYAPDPFALAPGDLDGDGQADIVMTIAQEGHSADGATGAWLIQADQTAAWGDLSQRNSGWSIFGTGVTTAGKATADVYVRSSDNVLGAWTTGDDGQVTGWETIGEFSSDTEIVGLGDFNGSGQTDLLLRNANGAVGCFFTNGEGWNYFQSLGDEWKLSAIGDLNGDGRDDVVLKHDAGFAGSWLTQSDGTMAWADLDTLPEGFAIVGAGDFDGDGTDDVLLQKGTYYGAWLVQNGNAAGWFGIGDLGNVTVEQIADFDGDGRDDLRIRTTAGDLGAQLVKGADTIEWKYYGSVGDEWSTSLAAL